MRHSSRNTEDAEDEGRDKEEEKDAEEENKEEEKNKEEEEDKEKDKEKNKRTTTRRGQEAEDQWPTTHKTTRRLRVVKAHTHDGIGAHAAELHRPPRIERSWCADGTGLFAGRAGEGRPWRARTGTSSSRK